MSKTNNFQFTIHQSQNLAAYLEYIDQHPHSGIWHYPEWGEFQISSGKAIKNILFSIKASDQVIFAGNLLIQKKARWIKYGYIPGGFLAGEKYTSYYPIFLQYVQEIMKKEKLLFIQIDSLLPNNTDFYQFLLTLPGHDLTVKLPIPQYSNIISLDLTEDEILKQMKPKGRYNIKKKKKKGVKVQVGKPQDVQSFYDLLQITTSRDGFKGNTKFYYAEMIKKLPQSRILIATHENDLLAAGIFTYTPQQALYYYGASSNHKRNLMAPYLLQWEAIKFGKSLGCKIYDFLGIADPENPEDSLQGVTEFKLKFGENITQFNPSYCIYNNKGLYSLYQFVINFKYKIMTG
ncbi:MAG: peptidoglycan bridge formation glycyltransferase FemA/FemB family protein [Spirochaetes bacterium]|nr:peptidoglycan bridge formation glycyltransferase FemA/FemB family protein [Spirochaetota bacterium]